MAEFESPICTVDAALFTLNREGALCVVLLRREKEPYAGQIALPGGFVHIDEDEDTEATARRVLRQKTGIDVPWLEQLYTFSGKVRDPRGWSVAVSYYALVPIERLEAETNQAYMIVNVDQVPALPFDHNKVIAAALQRLRSKSTYSSLPVFLLPEETFTLSELHDVYQKVLGATMDKAAFRRKIEDQKIITEAIGPDGRKLMRGGAHRPAQLYRLADPSLQQWQRPFTA